MNPILLLGLAAVAMLAMKGGGDDDDGDSGVATSTIREHVQNVKDTWDPVNDITPLTLTFSSGATVHKFYPEWTTEAYQSGDAEAVEIWDGVTQIYTDVFGVTPQPLPPGGNGTDNGTDNGGLSGDPLEGTVSGSNGTWQWRIYLEGQQWRWTVSKVGDTSQDVSANAASESGARVTSELMAKQKANQSAPSGGLM